MDYKAPDAFRTISEVAEELDLPQHVLRFWETRFSQIKPLKRGGGRRYYRPDDIDLLRGIRQLLYGEGYTIKGVQRILKEQGQRGVLDIGRGVSGVAGSAGETQPDAGGASGWQDNVRFDDDREAEDLFEPSSGAPARQDATMDDRGGLSRGPQPTETESPMTAVTPEPTVSAEPARQAVAVRPVVMPKAEMRGDDGEVLPSGILPEGRAVRPARFVDRMLGHDSGKGALSRDDVRRLQATLFELLECKRVLDQAR